LSGTDTKAARRLDRAFARRPVAISRAKRLATEFIDQAYISYHRNPWGIFGLTEQPSASPEHIRTRYRRLIRIFHPDRGYGDSDWLASRAEKINQAYRQLLDGNVNASDGYHRITGEVINVAELEAKYSDVPLRLRLSQALVGYFAHGRRMQYLLIMLFVVFACIALVYVNAV
jgi:preprotein translocase subunit Sec63